MSTELQNLIKKYTYLTIDTPPPKKLNLSKQQKLKQIGEFVFDNTKLNHKSNVKLAWHNHTSYAVKLLKIKEIDLNQLECELKALCILEHPHIIKIHKVVLTNDFIGIVMPWASSGDLFEYLKIHSKIDEFQAKQWFAELVSAVDFMQINSYAHHDIKLENIFIHNNKLVLGDFNLVESFEKQGFPMVTKACGSVTYCAPEVITMKVYDALKADLWSLGVVLYAMVHGFLPFNDLNFSNTQTSREIALQYSHILQTPIKFGDISFELQNLIMKMLEKNPQKRYSLSEIKQHEWLKGHEFSCPKKSNSFGSLFSESSVSTLQSYMETEPDYMKPVRGPIIWDPEAPYNTFWR